MSKRMVQCDDCGKFIYPDEGDDHISILHYKGKKTTTDLRKDLCMDCYYQYKRTLEHHRKTKGGILNGTES